MTGKVPWKGLMPAQIICGVAFNDLRLDIPAEGITADVVAGPLGQAQIEPATRDTLRRLFTASDAASYAASQSTAELRASLADLEQVIHELN